LVGDFGGIWTIVVITAKILTQNISEILYYVALVSKLYLFINNENNDLS